MEELQILHIFTDDKFFDSTSEFYDSLPGVNNIYAIYRSKEKRDFKYIKNVDKVTIVNNRLSYLKLLSRKDINILFFHSLPYKRYLLFPFIDKSKCIIWWSWGFDIYDASKYLPPIVKIENYAELTRKFVQKQSQKVKTGILHKLAYRCYGYLRKKAISRVNYFMPSAQIDYEMMKANCPYFHAQYFPYGINKGDCQFEFKTASGNIQIGNSLTETNNHLDIFQKIYSFNIGDNRKYIIPISYGNGYGGADCLMNLSILPKKSVSWIKDYMTKTEYFQLCKTVTHAVFGVLRQQALGNILFCLRTGVKVYLYKDSVVAKQLDKLGYIYFTIEEDLNEDSLASCMSKEDALHNYQVYMNRYKGRTPKDVLIALEKIRKTYGGIIKR